MKLFQTKWMAIALGALAYALTTGLCLQPKKLIEHGPGDARGGQESRTLTVSGPSWNFDSTELNQTIAELKEQREALKLRAIELDEWEKRLKNERQEIYAVTNSVQRLKTELDATVTRISEEETVNLKRLVKNYTIMTPEGAVRILREMQDDQVVKILSMMRESESAPILEALGQGGKDDPKRAAMIMDRLHSIVASPKSKKPSTP